MLNKTSFSIFFFFVAFFYYCVSSTKGPEYYNPPVLATHPEGGEFVGSQTCMECHADIHDAHIQTAHFNTSAIINADNINGSFNSGFNKVSIGEEEVVMLKQGNRFYQQIQFKDTEDKWPAKKMDVVIGSGVKGQSFLTWENDKLFQLQASYYPPADKWINSPGFPMRRLDRPINDGCLKCHVTYAKNQDQSGSGNQYNKKQILYGVDCERCHLPSAKHVNFHRNNPEVKQSKFMIKLDTLSRQRRLDACAQCHSGLRDRLLKGNSFSYLTGEPLEEYSRNFYTGQPTSTLDVHGNQYGLLTNSECFKQSEELDCSTCHDPHKKQRGNLTHFIEKCKSCHTSNTTMCKAELADRNKMGDNCVECHMPNTPSQLMKAQLNYEEEEKPFFIRNHLIGIYKKSFDEKVME